MDVTFRFIEGPEDVSVTLDMDAVPRVGDSVIFSHDTVEMLKKQLLKQLDKTVPIETGAGERLQPEEIKAIALDIRALIEVKLVEWEQQWSGTMRPIVFLGHI